MQHRLNKFSIRSFVSDISKYCLESLRLSTERLVPGKQFPLIEEPYSINWKNYYEILQVGYNANSWNISTSYRRLIHLYQTSLSNSINESSYYFELTDNTHEAYRVLSNPNRRRMYDQLFKAKYQSEMAKDPIVKEIVRLSGLVDRYVAGRKTPGAIRRPILPVALKRSIIIGISMCLLFLLTSTSFTIAKPADPVAQALNEPALWILRQTSDAFSLIEKSRAVAADSERSIVQSSINAMRMVEDVGNISPVTILNNDMSCFPSENYPLFPQYLDRQHSQFRYTIDENGNITVDASTATTDNLLEIIGQSIAQLEE
ncbi:DnaJ domain-containing protein [Chloroflexota bacterium]